MKFWDEANCSQPFLYLLSLLKALGTNTPLSGTRCRYLVLLGLPQKVHSHIPIFQKNVSNNLPQH